MNESYLEKCIRALPLEKQAAARAAIKDIVEGGDDSIFSKVLVILEATSAYAQTIPQGMAVFGEKFLAELDARLKAMTQAQADAAKHSDERIGQLIFDKMPVMLKSLALTNVVDGIDVLRTSVDRLARSTRRQRHVRLWVVAAFMALASAVSIGGTVAWFYKDYEAGQAAQLRMSALHAYGLSLHFADGGNRALKITLSGTIPTSEHTWLVNDSQENVGVSLTVPATSAE